MLTVLEKLGLERYVKINVTPENSELIQKWCFEKEVYWLCDPDKNLVQHVDKPFLCIGEMGITYSETIINNGYLGNIHDTDFIVKYKIIENSRNILWFCENNYYTTSQVANLIDINNSPFVSTIHNSTNWFNFNRVRASCLDGNIRVFIKVEEKEIIDLKQKLEQRLNFLNGLAESWK